MSDTYVEGLPAGGIPLRVGDVLSKAFSVFGNRLVSFLLLALVPLIPLLAVGFSTPAGSQLLGLTAQRVVTWGGLSGALAFVLGLVAQAMILYGAFQEMAGRSFSVAQSFGVGLARLLPLCCVAFLSALFTGVAFLLLFVPGVIVLCMLYVAIPVCVIERPGIFASLDRSATLTKGSRWQIFGLLVLTSIVSGIAQFVLEKVLGVATIWGTLFNFGWQVVATSFNAVLVAVVYRELRMTKEGMDIDNLANVFD
ncbi:MAG TPA: hypothetical protein VMM15_19230 [Bradyrhizobium sp.]|nr:hypothetical protein [Bradyrhizobium sp.]